MSTRKPDPARAWLFAEKLLASEEIEEVDSMDDEAVAAALRARGRDPERLTSVDHLVARAAALAAAQREGPGGPPAHVAPLASGRKRAQQQVFWLVAAAFGGLVVALLVMKAQPGRVGHGNPNPDVPSLRATALAACQDHRYADCQRTLDAARDYDPEGESAPVVQEARRAIEGSGQAPKIPGPDPSPR